MTESDLLEALKAVIHKAHIGFLAQVYNYTRTVDDLKILVNPDAKRFETKFSHRTPTMAEKIIDCVLSIKELLFQRPKKFTII